MWGNILKLVRKAEAPDLHHIPDAPEPEDPKGVTLAQSIEMARALSIPEWIPWTIAELEWAGNIGLTESGRPVLNFEPHYWRKYTGESLGRHRSVNLDYRWTFFEKLRARDEVAAIRCHSWGAYQIMGFNHRLCGFESVEAFAQTMTTIDGQMRCWKMFVLSNPPLLSAMRRERLYDIAHHYNGPQHERNKYVPRMERKRRQFMERLSWA